MDNQAISSSTDHYEGKTAAAHLAEKRAMGAISKAEVHGTEISGHLSSFADSVRETGAYLLFFWLFLTLFNPSFEKSITILSIFSLSLTIWKTGRGAWLGWSRLERMHRIVEQERYEIKNHRHQEREELKELYSLKGFEGKLLDEVVEVLMADDDRLLRVMVEEELCLSLESQEHPLKQGIGAFLGTFAASLLCLFLYFLFPLFGLWLGAFLTVSLGAYVSAYFEKNDWISAVVWNLGLLTLSSLSCYFLLTYLR
jgi:vacuolar iron transporter family protein